MPPKQQKNKKNKKAKTPRPPCKHQHRNQPALDRFGFEYHYESIGQSPWWLFEHCCTSDCPAKKKDTYAPFAIATGLVVDENVLIRILQHEDKRPITRRHKTCGVGQSFIQASGFKINYPKIRRWRDCFKRLSSHAKKRIHSRRFAALNTTIHPITNNTTPIDVLNVIASYL